MKLQNANFAKIYSNGVQALRNVTLTVSRSMFCVLGSNGAGQSTLLRILATLQEPFLEGSYFSTIAQRITKDS